MKKRILGMLLVYSLLIGVLPGTVLADTERKQSSGGEILQGLCREEVESVDERANVMSEKHNQSYIRGNYLESVMEASVDNAKNYGGCYIGDNDELVVLLTELSESNISYVESIVGNENVVYKECDISTNNLHKIKDEIAEFVENNRDCSNEEINILLASIVSTSIFVEENKVCVGLDECNIENISLFKKYIGDSDNIIFKDDEMVDFDAYIPVDKTINPGESINMSNDDGTYRGYSVGFRCKRLNSYGVYIYGFVTSAHENTLSELVYRGGVRIGYIAAISLADGGTVDAAFVCMNNSFCECPRVVDEDESVTLSTVAYVSRFFSAQSVCMHGFASGRLSGTVKESSKDIYFSERGITLKDLVTTSYISQSGDSGGIVYVKYNNGNCYTAGIHVGHSKSYSYFCKATNIFKVLNVSLY